VYDLGEDLVVGGGDRSNNRGQSAGSGSLAGEAAELRRAAHAASAAAAASRTAVQGEDGECGSVSFLPHYSTSVLLA
jgi:hypothetical protein